MHHDTQVAEKENNLANIPFIIHGKTMTYYASMQSITNVFFLLFCFSSISYREIFLMKRCSKEKRLTDVL